jgi:hypothetical protein
MSSDEPETPTQEGVREVIRQVARSEDIRDEHADIADILDDTALDTIADLAWRFQFDDDRTEFKKGLGALHAYVATTRQIDE